MSSLTYSQKWFQNIFIGFSLTFAMTSCKKDDPSVADKSLLFGKKWYLTAVTYNETGQDVTDNIACQQDDYIVFNANQTYDYVFGAAKCTGNEPDNASQTASWNLENNTLTLAPMTFEVMKLSPSELNLKTEMQGMNGKVISKRYYTAK